MSGSLPPEKQVIEAMKSIGFAVLAPGMFEFRGNGWRISARFVEDKTCKVDDYFNEEPSYQEPRKRRRREHD